MTTKKRGRRLLLPWAAAALAASLAAGVGFLLSDPFTQRHRLPDGRVLTLRGTSWGASHLTPDLKPWWAPLEALWRPRGGGTRWVAPRAAHATRGDALVVWISEQRPAKPPSQGFWAMDPCPVDEHGCRFPRARGYPSGLLDPSGRLVELTDGLELYSFPRRGRFVRLVHFDPNTHLPQAEFRILNPVPGPYPAWTPTPFPIARHSGAVEVVLTGLRHRETARGVISGAALRILEGGRPTSRWTPTRVIATDATGNAVTSRGHRDEAGVVWFDGLCRREAAWKIAMELAPVDPAAAPPLRKWTARTIAIPWPGKTRLHAATFSREGVTVDVHVTGASALPGTGSAPQRWVKIEFAEVAVRPPTGRHGLQAALVGAVTERGERAGISEAHVFNDQRSDAAQAGYPRTLRMQQVILVVPASAGSLDLTFALHRTHKVQFVAKP